MKKFIFSFLLCGATMFSAFSQTYQELSERAVAATEQDSLSLAEKYIEQALKMEPANPHNALLFSNLGTIQRRQHRYGTRSNVQCQSIRVKGLLIPVLPTLYRSQVGEQQSVMRVGRLHFQSLFNVFFGQ